MQCTSCKYRGYLGNNTKPENVYCDYYTLTGQHKVGSGRNDTCETFEAGASLQVKKKSAMFKTRKTGYGVML